VGSLKTKGEFPSEKPVMMKSIRVLLVAAVAYLGAGVCFGQSIVWSGAGDGTSWSDAQNWIGQQTPGPANHVFITNGAGGSVVISSIISVESLQCRKGLTISSGSLSVAAGSSSLEGALTLSLGVMLSASGAGTVLTSSGSVSADGANFNISGGAVMTLPALQNYDAGCGLFNWMVTGAGSMLNLPGLTNLTAPTCGSAGRIEAEAGGRIVATNLISINDDGDPEPVQADGVNSLVNFSNLQTVTGAFLVTFEASDGGTNLIPRLLGGTNVGVALNPGGVVPITQLRQLGSISATAVTNTFPALSNFNGGNVSLSAGAAVTLPALQNYDGGCNHFTWTVTGADSVLNLPGLTNMEQAYCGSGGQIEAESGGQILAASLASIAQEGDPELVQADGQDSLINFSGLMTVSGAFPVMFEVSDGATNLVSHLIGGTNLYMTLNPGGTLPIAQIQELGGITATATTNSFPALVDFDGGNVSLNGGAVATLPVLRNYIGGCDHFSWVVTGPGSVLNLPVLTNMTQPYCGTGGTIEAEAGGQIWAPELANIDQEGDPETVQVDGTNSLVDFSGLETVTGAFPVTFEVSAKGTNLVNRLVGGANLVLTINAGGAMPLTTVRQLAGITAIDGTNTFPALSNFDGGNISLSGGAVATLPALQNFSGGCGRFTWAVVGTNSVLNLPKLTNMTQPYCGHGGQIEAEAGGRIVATNLTSIDQESQAEIVQADGPESLLNFSNLQTVFGAFPITFEASGRATNLVPRVTGGTNLDVTINAGGVLPVGAMRALAGIVVSNVVANFTSLSNFDGASISVSGGAVVTLPALKSFSARNNGPTWVVTDSGSVLNLSALTNLLGSYCCAFNIDAVAGGELLLNNLVSVQDGNASFLSGGSGSLINLSRLFSFVSSTGEGQISAQNNGVILFNNQPFVLANVAVNIPAGNPVLPPTLIASPNLTLCATPWHSYRVEESNALAPNSLVTTLLVPMTNTFESVAAGPPPDTAIQITEFVANPPVLTIGLTLPTQALLVLYGLTNATYQLQSTTNLLMPTNWTQASVVAMTNSFRIFPETPSAAVLKFYRAEQE